MLISKLIHRIVEFQQFLSKKIVIFSYNKTKDNAIKSVKPYNFATMKTKGIKISTAPLFMLSHHTIKLGTFW